MINCILICNNSQTKKKFYNTINRIFQNFDLSYQIIDADNKVNNIDINQISCNDFSILFFDENIDKSFLLRISKSRPDIYLVIFNNKKEISFYYDYHIYATLPSDSNYEEYYNLVKSLISIHYLRPKRKIHFISNKTILLIDYNQIISLHYKNHKLFLTTLDSFYQVQGSLKNYMFLTKYFNFRLISRSIIINMEHKNKSSFVNNKLSLK